MYLDHEYYSLTPSFSQLAKDGLHFTGVAGTSVEEKIPYRGHGYNELRYRWASITRNICLTVHSVLLMVTAISYEFILDLERVPGVNRLTGGLGRVDPGD